MKPFMDEEFLLDTPTARELYHGVAERQPIVDYHCHVSPQEIAENRAYANLTQLWLEGDHYKWRLMRSCGVPEELITGQRVSMPVPAKVRPSDKLFKLEQVIKD